MCVCGCMCVCVYVGLYVCVCVRVCVYRLTIMMFFRSGVKVYQGPHFVRHYIPSSCCKPLEGSLVVYKHSLSCGHSSRTFAGHSQRGYVIVALGKLIH